MKKQIGASYEDLEWVMEFGHNKNISSLTEKETNLIKTYMSFNNKNKHKMEPIPVFNLSENNII